MTVAVASVAETAPVAVTTSGPASVPDGIGRAAVKPPSPFAVTTTGVPPGMETETDSFGANPVPVIVVDVPGSSVSGSAVIAVSYGTTVTSASAGVFDVSPVAVIVSGPAGVPAGIVTACVKSPSPFVVTVTGSPPGIVMVTVSFGAKPVPVTVVVPPGLTVVGSTVIAVSYTTASTRTEVCAGVSDRAPVAVNVTVAGTKSAGKATTWLISPSPFAVVTMSSKPGAEMVTDSFAT